MPELPSEQPLETKEEGPNGNNNHSRKSTRTLRLSLGGFVTHFVMKYGTPHTVLTDQGTNFLSDMFRSTCKLLKIKKIQSTAIHPETNGGIERSHCVLAEYLRHYIRQDQSDWDE
jgi:hypothetical protein